MELVSDKQIVWKDEEMNFLAWRIKSPEQIVAVEHRPLIFGQHHG